MSKEPHSESARKWNSVCKDLNFIETADGKAHHQGNVYWAVRAKERHLEEVLGAPVLRAAMTTPRLYPRLNFRKKQHTPPCLGPQQTPSTTTVPLL